MSRATPLVRLHDGDLEVAVSPIGAELLSVRDREDREWLWRGDPETWPRRAPVLFPVVGRCRDGVVRHAGRTYPMPPHGFAPQARFDVVSRSADACLLRLEDDESTRAAYRFAFRLEVAFALRGATLIQRATVTNAGAETLPFSLGFHPGFAWPPPTSADVPRERHVVLFDEEERAPLRPVVGGLIGEAYRPTPVRGRRLALDDALFAGGALVFDRLASRGLWFGAPGRPGIRVDLDGFPQLGLWTLPPARFLCVEPWRGFGDPVGFSGELAAKPGIVALAAGERRIFEASFGFADERDPDAGSARRSGHSGTTVEIVPSTPMRRRRLDGSPDHGRSSP